MIHAHIPAPPGDCGRTWTHLATRHECVIQVGHPGPHRCFCGAIRGMRP